MKIPPGYAPLVVIAPSPIGRGPDGREHVERGGDATDGVPDLRDPGFAITFAHFDSMR
jgi:hypothetical protein